MAILNRPGGVEIHWEEDGDGPLAAVVRRITSATAASIERA
jgi:hypothetical protein